MKVRFIDGTVKTCNAPMEQKVFKSSDSKAAGWMMLFNITEEMTSEEIDAVLKVENISELEFMNDDEAVLFSLSGYDKISSTTIRHSETPATSRVEVQLSKGL